MDISAILCASAEQRKKLMAKVKRFILFTGENFYPGGGWADFRESFLVEGDAEKAAEAFVALANSRGIHTGVWWQIADLTTGQIVKEGRAEYPRQSNDEYNSDALIGNEEELTIISGKRSRLKGKRTMTPREEKFARLP